MHLCYLYLHVLRELRHQGRDLDICMTYSSTEGHKDHPAPFTFQFAIAAPHAPHFKKIVSNFNSLIYIRILL